MCGQLTCSSHELLSSVTVLQIAWQRLQWKFKWHIIQLILQFIFAIFKRVIFYCPLCNQRHRRLDGVQVHSAKGDVSGQRAMEEEDTGMVSCCCKPSEEEGRLERERERESNHSSHQFKTYLHDLDIKNAQMLKGSGHAYNYVEICNVSHAQSHT